MVFHKSYLSNILFSKKFPVTSTLISVAILIHFSGSLEHTSFFHYLLSGKIAIVVFLVFCQKELKRRAFAMPLFLNIQ